MCYNSKVCTHFSLITEKKEDDFNDSHIFSYTSKVFNLNQFANFYFFAFQVKEKKIADKNIFSKLKKQKKEKKKGMKDNFISSLYFHNYSIVICS